MLRGAAVGGVALPLLAACGGGSDGGSGSGGSSDSRARAARAAPAVGGGPTVAASDVPVGGGTVLGGPKVVVTQPTQGRLQGVHGDLHPPGLHRSARSRTARSSARATAASSRSRTGAGLRPGSGPAGVEEGLRRRAARSRSAEPGSGTTRRGGSAAGRDAGRRAPAPRRTGRRGAARRSGSPRRPRAGRRCRRPATAAARQLGERVGAPDASPTHQPQQRRGQRGDHLDVRGSSRPAHERASVASPSASSAAQQRDGGVHGHERASAGRAAGCSSTTASTSSMPGTAALPGVSAQRHSSEPGVDQAAAAHAGRAGAAGRRSGGGPRRGRPVDSSCIAACQEKWLRLSTCGAGAGDPAVHPGEPGRVVAGLVVRVRPGVRRVAGARLDVEREAGELHRLVEAALLLAHERQQPGEPPVVAVRRGAALDDPPGVLRAPGDAGERDGRHRDASSSASGGAGRGGRPAGAESPRDVGGDRVRRGCARARCCGGRAAPRRAAGPVPNVPLPRPPPRPPVTAAQACSGRTGGLARACPITAFRSGTAVLPARAGVDPDPAGGLPVPGPQGPGHLRRQGQEPAGPAVVVLPGHRQPAPAHGHDGHDMSVVQFHPWPPSDQKVTRCVSSPNFV